MKSVKKSKYVNFFTMISDFVRKYISAANKNAYK